LWESTSDLGQYLVHETPKTAISVDVTDEQPRNQTGYTAAGEKEGSVMWTAAKVTNPSLLNFCSSCADWTIMKWKLKLLGDQAPSKIRFGALTHLQEGTTPNELLTSMWQLWRKQLIKQEALLARYKTRISTQKDNFIWAKWRNTFTDSMEHRLMQTIAQKHLAKEGNGVKVRMETAQQNRKGTRGHITNVRMLLEKLQDHQ
jgi:hypothetical protein